MASTLETLNALLAGKPITSDPRDVLYQARTATPSAQPAPHGKPTGPDRYRYYFDNSGYVYKRFDE